MKSRNHAKEEYDSLEDIVEFQKNSLNPGHYIGTGRVPPTVSAPGNAMPLVIFHFVASAFFLVLGLCLFFSDVTVTSSGLIESDTANKVIALIIFAGIAFLFAFLGFAYLRKVKKRKRAKKAQKMTRQRTKRGN